MRITFPATEDWLTEDRQAVVFEADVDGSRLICEISYEALFDHYQEQRPREAFRSHREEVETLATSLINRGHARAGTLQIRSEHFRLLGRS